MASAEHDRHHSPVCNRLLKHLSSDTLRRLLPLIETVELKLMQRLLLRQHTIHDVYFVEAGSVSMISVLQNGARAEVGLVGVEGMVGVPLLLGESRSSLEALVQVEGRAFRIGADDFKAFVDQCSEFRDILLRYVDTFLMQVSQTAACNGHHQIEQRLARWILMTADRAHDDMFTMTQAFMSDMLGVRRPRGCYVLRWRLRLMGMDVPCFVSQALSV